MIDAGQAPTSHADAGDADKVLGAWLSTVRSAAQ